MHSPRHTLTATLIVALSLCLFTPGGARASFAQTPQTDEREQAVKLYEAGDAAGAVKALQAFVKKEKKDVRAWHYLGLALSRQGKTKDARKAHEQSAKLATHVVADALEGISGYKELDARITPIKERLLEAADSADKYIQLSQKPSESKIIEWQRRAEFLRDLLQVSVEIKANNVLTPKEVTTKARIISKPSPQYTEEARHHQTTGTVVLIMIFSADGRVKAIIPIHSLPDGLTATAIEAARAIRFVPATVDGKPVSQFIRVEYNFNIY
jgi:TonB family protein